MTMILGFGAKNFYSFKEGFEVNLRLSAACPNDISKDKKYTNILALKGANASGKTNILKALTFLSDFVTNSFENKPDSEILFSSYFYNEEPTHLYIIFLSNNIEYKYELELTNKEIVSETIYKKNTIIIQRKYNDLTKKSSYFEDLKVIKLRNNSSIISTANQYDMDSIQELFDLFSKIYTNVSSHGMRDEFANYAVASKFYYENNNVFEFVKNILIKSDTGIKDIFIREYEDSETKEILYFPVFSYSVNNEDKFLLYREQSSGVKSLFKQLGIYKITLDIGGILALDEFDINLHPDLLPMLIDFFDNDDTNPNDSQLIFTTHNNEIMDDLKKYRVILVNKEENESFLYRLDEVSGEILRNDRLLTPIYNSGKLGGKPRLTL
jgi:AAA15 family ATPase/GTPase